MSFEAKITDLGAVDTGSGIPEGFVADLVTLAEAKNYIKQQYGTNATEDELITSLIQSSRHWIEGYLNLSVIKKRVVAYTRNELAEFELPYPPVIEVEEVVRVDLEGEEVELTLNTDYYKDGLTDIRLLFYQVFSVGTGNSIAGIKATYTAYMTEIPHSIKTACLKLVAENYYNRGDSESDSVNIIPFDVKTMCKPFRRYVI